jgi:hypothetical protein
VAAVGMSDAVTTFDCEARRALGVAGALEL